MAALECSSKPLVRVPCAIIERDGKVLAVQRSAQGSLALKWEFPGGKLEAGETEEEALIREIQEELSAEISLGARLSHTDRDDLWRVIRLIPFVCELISPEITLTEHEQMLWLTPEELSSLDWAEADRDVIEDYLIYLHHTGPQPPSIALPLALRPCRKIAICP